MFTFRVYHKEGEEEEEEQESKKQSPLQQLCELSQDSDGYMHHTKYCVLAFKG